MRKTGIYYYQITEINGKKPAYKYDGSKYVVAVNVTDNMAGKLTAAIISVTKDSKLVENKTVTFNNTYSASADLELKAQKSMKVESEQLGTFEFELSGDNIGKRRLLQTMKLVQSHLLRFIIISQMLAILIRTQ
ncbi:MAG: Spy0128 family protein [Ruminococcus sp.]